MKQKKDNTGNALDILKTIPLFAGLTDKDYSMIVPLLEPVFFKTETEIIREKDYGDSMYIIIEGNAIAKKKDESGSETVLGVLSAGSFFGELSLLDSLPRSASVISLEETRAFRLEKKSFDRLLAENIGIANTFYRNCLEETFSRFRNIASNLTFSQHMLNEKIVELGEINEDLSHAKKIQQLFIDTKHFEKETHEEQGLIIRHSYIYKPCQEIGGDFINILDLHNGDAGVVIADIMGHGITAALATGVLKSSISMLAHQYPDDPVRLITVLNEHFMDTIPQLYATCYYALISRQKRKITLCKAGHHHPFFWKKSLNGFLDIDIKGTGIGLYRNSQFDTVQFDIEDGDKILFFTDGAIEQFSQSEEMFSTERLGNLFRDMIISGEKNITGKIYKSVKDFSCGMSIDDDITILLLEFETAK